MIPTFIIDTPVLMLFGVLFSLFPDKKNGQGSVFASCYLWHALLFSSVFNAAVFYAYLKFPDWMWMYFLSAPRNTPLELVYIFLFFYYFPCILGFYLGRVALSYGKMAWFLFALFLVASEAWIVFHLFDRYSVIGTREQYLNHTAISLFDPQNPIGLVTNISVGLMLVYYLVLLWKVRKHKTYTDEEY